MPRTAPKPAAASRDTARIAAVRCPRIRKDSGSPRYPYSYVHFVNDGTLPVTVHVGRSKRGWPASWPVTTPWTGKSPRATVWFPHGITRPHIVAHEAVHIAQWARKVIGNRSRDYKGIVPPYCPSWTVSVHEVREEAFARIVDQFLERFEIERMARWHGDR